MNNEKCPPRLRSGTEASMKVGLCLLAVLAGIFNLSYLTVLIDIELCYFRLEYFGTVESVVLKLTGVDGSLFQHRFFYVASDGTSANQILCICWSPHLIYHLRKGFSLVVPVQF